MCSHLQNDIMVYCNIYLLIFTHFVVAHLPNPWTTACLGPLSFTFSRSFLKFMPTESAMLSNHLILCHSLLLLPSIFPSIRVSSSCQVAKVLELGSSNEYTGWIFVRIDWSDLLAIQGTLKSLLQHHNSKASFLRHSAFFTVQVSHPYMTTGKTIALTRRTFVGKVMSPLLNMLSRLVITFLPRSKHLSISWPQSPHAVISY